jgi:TolA-binding protein
VPQLEISIELTESQMMDFLRLSWPNPNAVLSRKLDTILKEIREMSTTTQSGLAALQNAMSSLSSAVSEEASAVQDAVTEIQSQLKQLSNSEDTQVQEIADQIQAQVAAIHQSTQNLKAAAQPVASPSPVANPVGPEPGGQPTGV